jgi:citrate synthase
MSAGHKNRKDDTTKRIPEIVLEAKARAIEETGAVAEPELTTAVDWPIECRIGPGLEGAIACESKIGYVNGTKGRLVYRGYDIFDLCAWSTFEETSYLLLHGRLPDSTELGEFTEYLKTRMRIPKTQRLLLSFPVEEMNPMSALRLGTNLMRQKQTYRDRERTEEPGELIASDDDSVPGELFDGGHEHPDFEFAGSPFVSKLEESTGLVGSDEVRSCYNLIGGIASIAATIGRVRLGRMPLEPHPDLGIAGNYLYMLTGRIPTPLEERIMDICLILHADHGMNASTFASMVVASTLSDIYLAIGAGISALSGPLHGGANVEVVRMLDEIGSVDRVSGWYQKAVSEKRKIMGFGHRVYKAYDPRARILGALASLVIPESGRLRTMYDTASALESEVIDTLGKEKKIFPNVDFYSGIVYRSMEIPEALYTTIFAVSRVAGWSARVVEYLENNRIFRPRAIYTGKLDEQYVPIEKR